MKKNLRNVLLYLGIPIVFILAIVFVSTATEKTEELKYSEIVSLIKNNVEPELPSQTPQLFGFHQSCKRQAIIYMDFPEDIVRTFHSLSCF